jgi:hypothetical protein
VELTLQDASNTRESSISESFQTQLILVKQENESLKKEISTLTNELKNKQMFSYSKEHHQKVEIQELE